MLLLSRLLTIVTFTLLQAGQLEAATSSPSAKVVGAVLLSNYEIKPLSANVSLGVSLVEASNFTEENRQLIVTVHLAFTQSWLDPGLKWEPADQSNITNVMLAVDKIWHPTTFPIKDYSKELAAVNSTGHVTWKSLATLEKVVDCSDSYDTSRFPFEAWSCHVRLDHSQRLNFEIDNDRVNVDDAKVSPLVKVTEGHVTLNDDMIKINFTIIRGNTNFYIFVVKLPLALLAFALLLPFILQPNSRWRVLIACTIFLALFTYGLLLLQLMGQAIRFALSGTPSIATFWAITLAISILVVFLTALQTDKTRRRNAPCQTTRLVFIDSGLARFLRCVNGTGTSNHHNAQISSAGAEAIPMITEASQMPSASQNEQAWITIVKVQDRLWLIALSLTLLMFYIVYMP